MNYAESEIVPVLNGRRVFCIALTLGLLVWKL